MLNFSESLSSPSIFILTPNTKATIMPINENGKQRMKSKIANANGKLM